VDGRVVAVEEITGVLTRLPCVFDQELVEIVPGDRAYVAAEMTAFLLSWLSELKCPVLNRPTPTCLAGPYWRPERWAREAARSGIPVRPVHRRFAPGEPPPAEGTMSGSSTVTVVGDRCLGAVEEAQAFQARRLADLAGIDLLSVSFHGADFLRADIWVDLAADGVADAIFGFLERPSARRT
jgi:hypothetical protein